MSQRKWFIRINVGELPLATARAALDRAQETARSQDRSLLTRPNDDGFYYVEIHQWAQLNLFLGFLRMREVPFEDRSDNPPTLGPVRRKENIDVRMDDLFKQVDDIVATVSKHFPGFGKPK